MKSLSGIELCRLLAAGIEKVLYSSIYIGLRHTVCSYVTAC